MQTEYMVGTHVTDHRFMANSDEDAIRHAREWARAEITAEAEPVENECGQLIDHEHVLAWRLETVGGDRQIAGAMLSAHVSAEPRYDAHDHIIVDRYTESKFRRL